MAALLRRKSFFVPLRLRQAQTDIGTKNIAAGQGTVVEIYSIADSPKDSYWLNYICGLNE